MREIAPDPDAGEGIGLRQDASDSLQGQPTMNFRVKSHQPGLNPKILHFSIENSETYHAFVYRQLCIGREEHRILMIVAERLG